MEKKLSPKEGRKMKGKKKCKECFCKFCVGDPFRCDGPYTQLEACKVGQRLENQAKKEAKARPEQQAA